MLKVEATSKVICRFLSKITDHEGLFHRRLFVST